MPTRTARYYAVIAQRSAVRLSGPPCTTSRPGRAIWPGPAPGQLRGEPRPVGHRPQRAPAAVSLAAAARSDAQALPLALTYYAVIASSHGSGPVACWRSRWLNRLAAELTAPVPCAGRPDGCGIELTTGPRATSPRRASSNRSWWTRSSASRTSTPGSASSRSCASSRPPTAGRPCTWRAAGLERRSDGLGSPRPGGASCRIGPGAARHRFSAGYGPAPGTAGANGRRAAADRRTPQGHRGRGQASPCGGAALAGVEEAGDGLGEDRGAE